MGSIHGKSLPPATKTHGDGQHTSGAIECDTSVLSAGKLTHCHNAHSKGQYSGGAMEERSRQGRKGEHTVLAVLEYTLVLVSVAVPAMLSPPPCKPKERARNVPIGAMERYMRGVQFGA